MPHPKFEDWTPPWGSDDSAFDAEKAKRLIYGLQGDKVRLSETNTEVTEKLSAAEAKVEEYETKDLSEIDRLKRENEKLRTTPPAKAPAASADDLRADRLEIALEKGLSKSQAARLVGTTREELEADADAYIEEHGIKSKTETKETKPPSTRVKSTLKAGTERDGDTDDEDLSDPLALLHQARGTD